MPASSARTPVRRVVAVSACTLALAATVADAQGQTVRYTGVARDVDTGRLLYTEVHEQSWEDGAHVASVVSYFDPQGHPIARKTLDFRGDPYVPRYRLDVPAEGYAEGITENGGSIVMVRTRRGEGERSERLRRTAPMAADTGVHGFVRARLSELANGEVLRIKLAVAGHLDSYAVRVRRVEDVRINGRSAIRVRIEHDSVLRFLLDPAELFYDAASQRLFEYRGTSNLRDPATGKPYGVRITYAQDVVQR